MQKNNRLNKAYRDALADWDAPVSAPQWNRLETSLQLQKSRKGLPIFWVIGLLCFTCISTWFLASNFYKNQYTNTPVTRQHERPNSPEHGTATQSETLQQRGEREDKLDQTHSQMQPHQPNASFRTANTNDYFTEKSGNETPHTGSKYIEKNPAHSEQKIAADNDPETTVTQEMRIAESTPPELAEPVMPGPADNTLKEKEGETEKTTKRKNKGGKDDPEQKGIHFTFAAGLSGMKNQIRRLEQQEKQHQDSRQIFEANNKQLQTAFAQLGVEFAMLPKIRLGLSSGLQIRQMSSKVNLYYVYNQIPFRDADGTILGYIPDSSDPEVFQYKSTNTTTYASVPLCLRYPIMENEKQELLAVAGLHVQFTLQSSGKYFTINQPEIISMRKNMLNPINMGYLSGLQYARKISDSWWLGAEAQWQSTPQNFNNSTGKIYSNVRGINAQFIVKYKI